MTLILIPRIFYALFKILITFSPSHNNSFVLIGPSTQTRSQKYHVIFTKENIYLDL